MKLKWKLELVKESDLFLFICLVWNFNVNNNNNANNTNNNANDNNNTNINNAYPGVHSMNNINNRPVNPAEFVSILLIIILPLSRLFKYYINNHSIPNMYHQLGLTALRGLHDATEWSARNYCRMGALDLVCTRQVRIRHCNNCRIYTSTLLLLGFSHPSDSAS